MAGCEVLTVAEMTRADALAVEAGVSSLTLMDNAGRAVADAVQANYPSASVLVLCGPGNNGGDGYSAADHLTRRGYSVRVASLVPGSRLKGDAAQMAACWKGSVGRISAEIFADAELIVDALFGAGLSRPLDGAAAQAVRLANESGVPILAVDVPSGVHGDVGRPLDGDEGVAIRAHRTVTFFRKKPAHLLMPGRDLCGEIAVAGIGIADSVLATIRPNAFENDPELWRSSYPWPRPDAHKYARGHAVVVSGPAHATGAARLAARGALRIGAGLASIASPLGAVPVNAAHLTAIMVKPFEGGMGLSVLLADRRFNAVALGPGSGVGEGTKDLVAAALDSEAAVVLDADALTSFAANPSQLFAQLRPNCVLTPHAGEFERLFPGLLKTEPSKLLAARAAARISGSVVLLKGPDTVSAAPDGKAVINANAPPWLATAGAGDVLTGIIAGLLAQGMSAFDAACAAAWLHGEAASVVGLGLIAEDIPEALPEVLRVMNEQ
jgi:NAD(P)H-hydrate epimerase